MASGDLPLDTQATLTIDLGTIIANYKNCVSLSGGVKSAAMVKADAYGMGIAQVAPALFHKAGCKDFFVANLAEAVKLRHLVPEAIIYALNGVFPGHESHFMGHNIRPVLNDPDQISLWSGTNAPCAIHFDTGINRLGLSPEDTDAFMADTALQSQLDISLVMSHLACSDEPKNQMNARQLTAFQDIVQYFPHIPASLANSGGILLGPEYHFDLLRPGLLLFGGNPVRNSLPRNIKMCFQITGKILQIRKIMPGQSVGYGARWTADKPRHIATINIGYADGYGQKFNDCGLVYAKGRRLPVVGQVSMDMIAVDVTDIEIAARDEVELLGAHITLELASKVSNLSQYEILTGVRERYQRVYI